MLTPMNFEPKFDFFKKPIKIYIHDHYVQLIRNMGFPMKNVEFRSIFATNWRFLIKPKANNIFGF
jgi:hypothetical protein